jgi:hypothetical protein
METLGNNLEIKTSKTSSSFFVCELCDYKCCRKFNLDRHVLSSRHIKEISRKEKGAKNEQNEQITDFTCEQCNKIYKTNAGLWKHKKLCNNVITQNIESSKTNEIHELKEIMKYLIKENTEMKIMMMDVIKTGTNNTTNNNTNSHNKTFNLNLFLNETCKDALNISDFVSSIKVSLSDLENTGRQGYVEGISNIILKNLNNLEQYQRPIHCSDFKREVIYIKDNDKWEKEGEEKPLLTKAIKVIANENIS